MDHDPRPSARTYSCVHSSGHRIGWTNCAQASPLLRPLRITTLTGSALPETATHTLSLVKSSMTFVFPAYTMRRALLRLCCLIYEFRGCTPQHTRQSISRLHEAGRVLPEILAQLLIVHLDSRPLYVICMSSSAPPLWHWKILCIHPIQQLKFLALKTTMHTKRPCPHPPVQQEASSMQRLPGGGPFEAGKKAAQ